MSADLPRHPEARTMTAFIEGTLPPPELGAVSEHLRGCGECRTVVAETARFERQERELAPRVRSPKWWLAAAAVLAVIALSVPLLRWIESRSASHIERLIAAAPREHRAVDARIAGFPWARLQPPQRGGSAAPTPADMKLTGVAGEVLEKTADQRTPESRHAAGVAYLVTGRRAEALTSLERAAGDSNDARIWSDLAAARYGVAVHDERPSQLPVALADADSAIRLDPRLAEAHFNRALIVERLGLRDQARKAWQRYLEIDGSSEWSLEARARLRSLDRQSRRFDPKLLETMPAAQLVREFPQEARTWSEGKLLADWADLEKADDSTRAAAILARVRAIANALAAFNGERLLEDAVAAIERSKGASRVALVDAHRLYRDARLDYRDRKAGVAENKFREAAVLFRNAGSPMFAAATYYAASAAFDQQRAGEARDELTALRASIPATHRAMTAEVARLLAVIGNAGGDWGGGAREADAAAATFRSLGEEPNALFLDAVAAIAYEMMGERDLAWLRRIRTHAGFSAQSQQAQLSAILRSAALTLALVDETRGAGALIDLSIDDARGDATQLALSLTDRARDAIRGNDLQAARASIDGARAAARRLSDPRIAEYVGAHIDLAEAAMRSSSAPRAAVALLDRAIPLFAQGGVSSLVPEAYLQRGRAYRASGDESAALADYENAMREIGKQRSTIGEHELRLRFLDTAAQTIDETIDLRLSRGEIAEAFAVADEAHTILESNAGRPSAPSAAVPPRIAIVEYAVLPQAVIAFCVSSQGISAAKLDISRRELASRVDSLVEKIRRRAPVGEIQQESALLYRQLIAPVRQRLEGIDEIVLVPDRQLSALPFAALWDEAEKRYLAEGFTIRFAPSAAAIADDRSHSLSPALVLADPPTAQWPRLPASRAEGARVAALHGATLLSAEAATRAAFLQSVKRSALIHYAGHANSNAGDSYGALLLADGVLGSSEIARLDLTARPLVVLAACGTFRGNNAHVSGMSSLARSFLIAGARGVAGTLWELDDDVSASFFSRFHEHLRAGASPASALRATQIDMIRSSDARLHHPATWSPVQYLGNV